jgi:arylsulfatase
VQPGLDQTIDHLVDELLRGVAIFSSARGNARVIGDTTYRVHLDGYDQSAILTGSGPSQRKESFYFTEAQFHGIRYGDWKFLFTEQDKWFNGVKNDLVTPLITNLKLDPFERFHEARGFDEWQENRSWTLAPAMASCRASSHRFRSTRPVRRASTSMPRRSCAR